jgi:peptidoglycan/xylan/chitin deacetylase (PgdA/CDA1 family)
MYIGSVRFFKHLILTVIALLIIVPTIGCVYFVIQYNTLKAQIALETELLTSLAAELDELDELADTDEPIENIEVNQDANRGAGRMDGAIPYQLMHTHLFIENDFQFIDETEKTVYLTFDDGPTPLTPQVLDILKDHGVPATFFVVYRRGDFAEEMYRRIVDEGHVLALHSASHDYRLIYSSVEAFFDDFARLSDMLEEVTGVKPELFRFPGGSNNSFIRGMQQEVIAELLRRGYTYYDWDVSSGSATPTATVSSVYSNVINGVGSRQRAIILMHDAGTSATVTALPRIIDTLKASGYQFEILDKTVRPTFFNYLD